MSITLQCIPTGALAAVCVKDCPASNLMMANQKTALTINIEDRIQYLRKTKGFSQEELADKMDVSRQAVSKWESEQSIPDVEKIITMSKFFEATTGLYSKMDRACCNGAEKGHLCFVCRRCNRICNHSGYWVVYSK